MKLGRLKSRHDPRNLFLSDYLRIRALPTPPDSVDWTHAVHSAWGMMANDRYGDCVYAAAGHMEMQWTFNAGNGWVPETDQILAAYSEATGFNPQDPDTDNGDAPLNALKYWRKVGIGGHKIGAYVQTSGKRPLEIKHAIHRFEGSFMAFALPAAVEGKATWDIPPGQSLTGEWEPWSWGGHMVEAPRYNDEGVSVVSWGEEYRVSWAFVAAYCDESYAILSDCMLKEDGKSPLGLDINALREDLQAVTKQ
jgi:hypothetical protein